MDHQALTTLLRQDTTSGSIALAVKLLQALAARQHGVLFWVLADSFKDSPVPHNDFPLEALPAESDLTISRITFKPIATTLISGRVTENGPQPT